MGLTLKKPTILVLVSNTKQKSFAKGVALLKPNPARVEKPILWQNKNSLLVCCE